MKQLALKTLLFAGTAVIAVSAIAVLAIPAVYWLSEGFTRWG